MLPVSIILVMLLIAGSLGGWVLLRKRGLPVFGLAGLGSNGQKTPSIPWTRNQKIEPVFDNGNAQAFQAGAFAANGQAWTTPNNAQTMLASSGSAFAATSGKLPQNPQPLMPNSKLLQNSQPLMPNSKLPQNSQPLIPNSNQPYTPSALRPITTSLPAQYPHSRPLNTIQTSDMRPLPMDSLDFSKVFNQQADADTLRQLSPQITPGAFPGVATQLARPDTAPLAVPPSNTPAPEVRLATGPLQTPPAMPLLNESQLTSDPMLETIMRQAQMGLYVLPDKQTPNRMDSNH